MKPIETAITGADSGRTFTIRRFFEQGGHAEGYEVQEGTQQYALKLPIADSTFATNNWAIHNDAYHLNRLRHPHILRFELFDKINDYYRGQTAKFLVTELADTTLLRYRATKELVSSETLQIGLHTAQALAFVHAEGILHNDLQTRNVFLLRDDEKRIVAKLGDLGGAIPVSTDLETAFSEFSSEQKDWGKQIVYRALGGGDYDYDHRPRRSHFGISPRGDADLTLFLPFTPREKLTAYHDVLIPVAEKAIADPEQQYESMAALYDDLQERSTKLEEYRLRRKLLYDIRK